MEYDTSQKKRDSIEYSTNLYLKGKKIILPCFWIWMILSFICHFNDIIASRVTWSDCSPASERSPKLATSASLDLSFGGRIYKWMLVCPVLHVFFNRVPLAHKDHAYVKKWFPGGRDVRTFFLIQAVFPSGLLHVSHWFLALPAIPGFQGHRL